MWYSWLNSYAIGYEIFVIYLCVVEVGKWLVRRRIDRAISRTYRTGHTIHGPDDI
jgi:hypothetical protein